MPTLRALVTIPMTSGIAEDAVTNTWYFQGEDVPLPMVDDATAQLQAFYSAIDVYLSNEVAAVANVKYYDLDDPEPRLPVHEDTIALVPTAQFGLPHEVAIALSFAATVASGDNPARKRGRIFLGPLHKDNVDNGLGGSIRPKPAMVTAIAAAGEALQDAGSGNCQWVIYSPTHHEGRGPTPANPKTGYPGAPATPPHDLADSVFNVTRGWVDNAFDTIRSRGEEPSSRVAWS